MNSVQHQTEKRIMVPREGSHVFHVHFLILPTLIGFLQELIQTVSLGNNPGQGREPQMCQLS